MQLSRDAYVLYRGKDYKEIRWLVRGLIYKKLGYAISTAPPILIPRLHITRTHARLHTVYTSS